MKKIATICISLIFCIGMLVCISTDVFASTNTGFCGVNASWSFDEATGTLTISGTGDMYNSENGSMSWSMLYDKIVCVVIEDGITSICNKAFYEIKNLKEVSIPDSVTSIGKEAFARSGLTYIELPDSITYIDEQAFSSSQLEEITIPSAVKELPFRVLSDCKKLKKVVLHDNLICIGDYAFCNCSSLQTIAIPDSVTEVKASAFEGCTKVTEISIGKNVTRIPFACFRGCDNLKEIFIPDSVTSIEPSAFENCRFMEKVTLGNGVQSIGGMAFYNCSALKTLIIPASVTFIDEHAFGSYFDEAFDAISFLGNPPQIAASSSEINTNEIWYPAGNIEWTNNFPEKINAISRHEGCGGSHNLVEGEIVQPTCSKEGSTASVKCKDCGFVSVAAVAIPTSSHTYGKWEYITSAESSNEQRQVKHTCTICGYEETKFAVQLDESELPEEILEDMSENTSEDTQKENPSHSNMWVIVIGVILGMVGIVIVGLLRSKKNKED